MSPPTSFIAHISSAYDVAGNLRHIQTAGKSTAGGADGPLLSSLNYCYTTPAPSPCQFPQAPPAGSTMTSIKQSVTEAYDNMARLTTAATTGGPSYNYGWDANSNRTSDEAGTHSFNSADQLTDTGFAYDAAGNQTASPSFPAASYNGIEQTTSITASGQAPAAMSYAAMGQAERTISPAGTAQNGAMGVQTETLGGQTTSYIRDASGSLVYERTPSADFYYFFDGLGSVIGLIDATSGLQRATNFRTIRSAPPQLRRESMERYRQTRGAGWVVTWTAPACTTSGSATTTRHGKVPAGGSDRRRKLQCV